MNELTLYTLASLAVAALPDSRIVGLRPPQYSTEDLDVTGVIDDQGQQFVVVAPRTSAAGASLEAQYALLISLSDLYDQNQLIVEVPRPIAMGRTRRNGDVMVHQKMSGVSMTEANLENPALGASVGRALASLHQVHPHNLDNAGMPVYRAEQIRAKHRNTLTAVQNTGLLPARLFQRWSQILDDDKLWRFRPCTVPGDLEATSFLVVGNVIMGMRDFSRAHVGDPAQDFAWALATAGQDFVDQMLSSYLLAYPEHEETLEQRAQFITEIDLAGWLLPGRASNDPETMAEAAQMLKDLADQIDDSLDFTSFVPVAGETEDSEASAEEEESEITPQAQDADSDSEGASPTPQDTVRAEEEESPTPKLQVVSEPEEVRPKLKLEDIPERDPDSVETYVMPVPWDETQK